MIYTERKNLTVLELTEERDTLSYDELIPVLIERPSNVIYVELHGRLYGIVTIGHIIRTLSPETRQVVISKKFTSVASKENGYLLSRRLFKDNGSIVFVPVANSEGKLLGEWAKEDGLSAINYIASIVDNPKVAETLNGLEIVLVRPCAVFEKKRQLFLFWKQLLERKGASLTVIDSKDVEYYFFEHNIRRFVFVDFCEAKGVQGSFCMSVFGKQTFIALDCVTYRDFILRMKDEVCEAGEIERIFCSLQTQNVSVLGFHFMENEHGFLWEFQNRIQEKYRSHGIPSSPYMFPEMRKDFLGELYEKYMDEKMPIEINTILMKDGFYILRDTDTPILHASQGKRQTVGQPDAYECCVYVAGPCMIAGIYVEDQYTIPSLLQKELNLAGFSCKVINLGLPGVFLNQLVVNVAKILNEDLKQGDIVLFDTHDLSVSGIQMLSLTDALEESQAPIEWFANEPRHCNHKANQLFAKAMYEKLLPVLRQPVGDRKPIEKGDNIIKLLYIDQYFSDFDSSQYEKIGSIVMNCNPFTFGHRHLIEYAAERVDFLIIFVVEEDASLFTFEERFAMVCEGTADLKNVKAVPSGDFILSKRSFPEYFMKEADEDIVQNTENDITLFAEKIAPVLGITHRFVGEEPEDEVTNAYNRAMKKILPAHGIELVEIPRKQDGKAVISASRVRKCLEENTLEALDTLIPESTMRILFCVNE